MLVLVTATWESFDHHLEDILHKTGYLCNSHSGKISTFECTGDNWRPIFYMLTFFMSTSVLSACTSMCHMHRLVPTEARRTEIPKSCIWAAMWLLELNSGPLEKRSMFLLTEPSLQLLIYLFLILIIIFVYKHHCMDFRWVDRSNLLSEVHIQTCLCVV